jgi:hypothetical protein
MIRRRITLNTSQPNISKEERHARDSREGESCEGLLR